MASPFEILFSGLADAIEDIRHKLVEEGWFGKETTDGLTALERLARDNPDDPDLWAVREDMGLSGDPQKSFDDKWRVEPPAEQGKDIGPNQDHGLDR